MKPVDASRLNLRHLLVVLPVVAVWAVLSTAAVVGLVSEPSNGFAVADSSAEPAAGGAASDSSEALSLRSNQLPSDLPEVGTYARASVLPDGDVAVVEWVRTAVATTSLTLSLPPGSPTASAANDVVVMSADGPATGPAQVTSSGSYVVTRPTTVFVSRYLLSGVARLSPTSQTRALVQPVALSLSAGPSGGEPVGGPRLLSVESGSVLALACSVPGEETVLTPCGAPHEEGWQVELDSTRWSALVAAQVDLE